MNSKHSEYSILKVYTKVFTHQAEFEALGLMLANTLWKIEYFMVMRKANCFPVIVRP